jgi:acyl-CoA thioesterase-1
LYRERHVPQDGDFLFAAHVFFRYVTSDQHEGSERILMLTSYKATGRILLLAVLFGCGADGNAKGATNSRETKDNMSAAKGAQSSTAVSAQKGVRTPVVLFFGTSLTAGYGLDPEQAFPSLIEQKARADGVPIRAINAGLSGETSAGAVRRIDWVLRTPADLVVIEVGANDALRGLSTDAAKSNLERVIASVKAKQPRAQLALIQMEAPPNYGTAYTRSFRSIYAEVARKEGIPLLPFLLNGVAGISRLNQPDGLHPNLTGERIVADNVWKSLKPIVAQLDRG